MQCILQMDLTVLRTRISYNENLKKKSVAMLVSPQITISSLQIDKTLG